MSKYIVTGPEYQVACRTLGANPWPTWEWTKVLPRDCPPSQLLSYETEHGARLFAEMNGGKVATILEYFYSPHGVRAA